MGPMTLMSVSFSSRTLCSVQPPCTDKILCDHITHLLYPLKQLYKINSTPLRVPAPYCSSLQRTISNSSPSWTLCPSPNGFFAVHEYVAHSHCIILACSTFPSIIYACHLSLYEVKILPLLWILPSPLLFFSSISELLHHIQLTITIYLRVPLTLQRAPYQLHYYLTLNAGLFPSLKQWFFFFFF